jgi:hypothetical protein
MRYLATTNGAFDHSYRFVAIEVGVPPASCLWERSGLNWARTSAAIPEASPPDAGVDGGSVTDAGVDGG